MLSLSRCFACCPALCRGALVYASADVLAERGLGVGLRALQEQGLRILVVLVLALPRLDARRLQRPREAERQPALAGLLHLMEKVLEATPLSVERGEAWLGPALTLLISLR